jgi:hypothetical protein
MTTRRDILAVLGLAAAGSAAVAAEDVADPPFKGWPQAPGLATPGPEFQERVARTLERLAAALRRGEVGACGMNVSSAVTPNEWLEHVLTIRLELPLGEDEQ